jgi:mono/diheme cytochrome c family protein
MSQRVRMHFVYAIVLATALTVGWSSAAAGFGTRQVFDESRRTILDGVFTPAQTERGRSAYEAHCSSCHSEDLRGMSGPPLAGQQFIDTWREDSVSLLFDYIRTRMPTGDRGSLSDQSYIDIVTHILSLNDFPSGPEELTVAQLESVQFVGRDGPAPVPEFSLIQVVGCLEQDPGGDWMLTEVSTPIRTSDPEGATEEELQAAMESGPGAGTYRLVYMEFLRPGFLPERNVGHKVYAKGYLLRNDSQGDGLSLTRLESVATTCNELI